MAPLRFLARMIAVRMEPSPIALNALAIAKRKPPNSEVQTGRLLSPLAAKPKKAGGEPKRAAKKIVPRPAPPAAQKVEAASARASAVQPAAITPKPIIGKTPEERLRFMIGQLLLAGFDGKRPAEPDVARTASALNEGKLSGVIISDANIESSRQLQELLEALHSGKGDNIPLVAIEQPGGADAVLNEDKGFHLYGAPNFVANDRSPYDAQLLYREMAGELSALGVNLNIGPSADVCTEGGVNLSAACFGTAPSQVAAYATAFNAGHHDRGVLTALKHSLFARGAQTSPIYEQANIAMFREVARKGASDAIVVRVKSADQSLVPYSAFRGETPKNQKRIFRRASFEGVLIADLDVGSRRAPLRPGRGNRKSLPPWRRCDHGTR